MRCDGRWFWGRGRSVCARAMQFSHPPYPAHGGLLQRLSPDIADPATRLRRLCPLVKQTRGTPTPKWRKSSKSKRPGLAGPSNSECSRNLEVLVAGLDLGLRLLLGRGKTLEALE